MRLAGAGVSRYLYLRRIYRGKEKHLILVCISENYELSLCVFSEKHTTSHLNMLTGMKKA